MYKNIKKVNDQDPMGKLLHQSHVLANESNPLASPVLDQSYQFTKLPWKVGLDSNTQLDKDIKSVGFGNSSSHVFRGVNIRPDSIWLKITLAAWDATTTNYIQNIFDCILNVTVSLGNKQLCQYDSNFLNLFYWNLQDSEYRTFLSAAAHMGLTAGQNQALAGASSTYYIPIFVSSNSNRNDNNDIDFPMIRCQDCDLKIDIAYRAVTSASPAWILGGGALVPTLTTDEIIIQNEQQSEHLTSVLRNIPSITKQTTMTRYTENLALGATKLQSKMQLSSKVYGIAVRPFVTATFNAGATLAFNATIAAGITSCKLIVNGKTMYDTQQNSVLQYNQLEKFDQFGHLDFTDTNFLWIGLSDNFIKSLHNSFGYLDLAQSSNTYLEIDFGALAANSLFLIDIFEHQIVSVNGNTTDVKK